MIEQDYYYIDKTMYIEKLEDLPQPYIMFLRPRKFGKTLFTSMIENYYDITKAHKFEKLYSETYLNNLSNRDFQRFSEKYIKLMFYCIAMNLKTFRIKSELEVQRKYPDILLIPKERDKGYKAVMIEFKYLKKDEEHLLSQKQEEARKQIEEYASFAEIRTIENLNKYTIVAVNDKLYAEKI